MSETDYLNQIEQLVKLQKIDDDIFEVREGVANAPRILDELQHKFDSISHRRNHLLDKISHIEDQKKRLALENAENTAKIRKSKDKMMQVGNEREHQAIVREMDTLERTSRAREEEQILMSDELQRTTEALGEVDKDYNEVREELEQKTSTLEENLQEAKERLAVLDKQRKTASESIPRPIFQRYEFIRERLEHPVIVPVDEGICSGCHIAIPPQAYIECQRGQQILSCPNCQRLIFWSDHFSDPDMPKTVKKAKKRRMPEPDDEGPDDLQDVEEMEMEEDTDRE